ncbi:hypothetical protein [Sneathiella chinensis]|uniref:Uncharacterized protein n=1 Tax=Sneathiella chinensis TaxID=349750 RepID=A0ABQ5U8V6_9PROT|nr:hypothetical protein [Sneathiella chinensis]GLQ07752.1 hypothetical protein GCM10007924_29730 [Sneathiella chinensis]
MSFRALVAVAIRLAGVFILVSQLYSLMYEWEFWVTENSLEYLNFFLLAFVFSLVGLLMISFPVALSGLVLKGIVPSDEPMPEWKRDDLQSVGVMAVGVFLLSGVAVDASYYLTQVAQAASGNDGPSQVELIRDLVPLVVQAVLALWLSFGARGLVSLFTGKKQADTKTGSV